MSEKKPVSSKKKPAVAKKKKVVTPKKKKKPATVTEMVKKNFKGSDEDFEKTVTVNPALDPIIDGIDVEPVLEEDFEVDDSELGEDFVDLPMSGLQGNQTIGELNGAGKSVIPIIETVENVMEGKKFMSNEERMQMNLNAEKLMNLKLKKEIIEGRRTNNKTQAEFIKAKLEVVERDSLLLDHSAKDIADEINEFLIESRKYVATIRHTHGIKASNFGYDPDSGEISND